MNAILTHAEAEAAVVAACAPIHQPGEPLSFGSPYANAMEDAAHAAMGVIGICDAIALHDYLHAQTVALLNSDEGGSPRYAAMAAGRNALRLVLITERGLSREAAVMRGMFLLERLRPNFEGSIIPDYWLDAAINSIADDLRTLGKEV